MKRISSLFLSACLLCGVASPANASDFWISGYTMMKAQMSNNMENFSAGADDWRHFDVNQRIVVDFSWVASETLNAKLNARVPQNGTWGNNNDFNTQNYFNLYEAYLNWFMPIVDVDFTIGQQYFVLPGYMGTSANPVYDDHQVGIALKRAIGDSLAINFNFIRMENAAGRLFTSAEATALGAVKASKDVYTLELPVRTDMINLTPWGAVAFLSEGREINTEYSIGSGIGDNELAYVGSEEENHLAYYAGLTTKFKPISNISFGVDVLVSGSTMKNGEKTTTLTETKSCDDAAEYNAEMVKDTAVSGTITYDDDGTTANAWEVTHKIEYTFDVKYNMGYLADAYISYDLPFATIGFNGWYASGDKIDLNNETIEYGSLLSLNGSWGNERSAYFAHTGLLHSSGVTTPAGTLGGGLTLVTSPMDKLNLGFNAMYVMGTNEYINASGDKVSLGSVDFLTAKDYLVDLGAAVSYDIYNNFQVNAGGNYIIPTYDGLDSDNGFVLGVGLNYIF